MKIVHLIQYHLGGGRKRKGGKGGHTPAPQLPNAGKPYVDSISYDKNAKKVRLRAQNARAGEVKTPLGDWQEFPVDVPEPTPLPDAGKPFVEGVTYDPDTKKVKVRAKVAQAGEVKDPIGEEQEFPIHVPTPPAPPAPTLPDAGKPRVSKFNYDPTTRKVTVQASVSQAGEVKTPTGDEQTFDIPAEAEPITGVVYEYLVDNMTAMPQDVAADTGTPPPGEQMGAAEATLYPADPPPGPMVSVYSYVKPFPVGIQLSLRPLAVSPGKASYLGDASIYVLGSNLVISRQVSIVDN